MYNSELKIEYSDKQVIAWGGMKLMKNLLEKSKIKEFIQSLPLPVPGSNRGYSPIHILESFWVGIWIGASRFSHSDYLRFDSTLKEIFDWSDSPSQSTFSRFFHKFNWKRNNEVCVSGDGASKLQNTIINFNQN